ncbi:recombinase family protein [Bacillus sp. NPDC077411]|uniref:recombinase family protein n=1 Tax=Bacillus sp. NPDC077411 TaxID=3363947 RepID=UPI0037C8C470
MKYGYARVSTLQQCLEIQIQQLKEAGCEDIRTDKCTGTRMSRPSFTVLLDELQAGDTLVVTKLDRFARSTKEAIETIQTLFSRGVAVHVLNIGVIEDTPAGRLLFNVFSAFAEFERDMIVERTQEGKAIAKQSPDYKEGRPKKFNKAQIDHALTLLESNSLKQVSNMTGISESTLTRAKRKRRSEV